MQTYVIDTANLESGWLKDSVIVPDDKAPADGWDIYRKQMQEKTKKITRKDQ